VTNTDDKPIKLNTDTYLLDTATEIKSTSDDTTIIKKYKLELHKENKITRTLKEREADYLLHELDLGFEGEK
jgi:hypothetical protein